MIRFVPATEEHISIAPRLIELPRICRMVPFWTPEEVVRMNIRISHECETALVDEIPACIYGLHIPDLFSKEGMPWLLATDIIKDHKIKFLRSSKRWVERLKTKYNLRASVDPGFEDSKNWLDWLGVNYGPN